MPSLPRGNVYTSRISKRAKNIGLAKLCEKEGVSFKVSYSQKDILRCVETQNELEVGDY